MGYGDEETGIYNLYKAQDSLDEFYKAKPVLTNHQHLMLNCFYRLSQERRHDKGVPLNLTDKDIRYYQKYNGSCSLPADLFIIAIRAIDCEYINNKHDEIRRKNKG